MASEGLRFLVVDDNRLERLKLSWALASHAHTVSTADSGPHALEMLRAEPFDLVFRDIVMPDVDGFEVQSVLKDDAGLRATPVVMVSGSHDAGSVRSCMELGAQAHLAKPVTAEALESAVASCLDSPPSADPGR